MIELNTIYNEDCLKGMENIPDKTVNLVCCDLPYGTTDYAWDTVIEAETLWNHYRRILVDNGTILLFGSEPFSTKMRIWAMDLYKYDFVWKKSRVTGFQHAKNMPLKDYELISVFSKGGMGHANLLKERRMTYNPQGLIPKHREVKNAKRKAGGIIGQRPSHVDEYTSEFTNYPRMVIEEQCGRNDLHPTQKPVELVEYLVRTFSNEGDIVLDNCMGSGTTAIACLNSGRKFIGFETEPKFVETALNRIGNWIDDQLNAI